MSKMTGGCSCGRVRYEVMGPPSFSVMCHCRDCQRASGSAGVPVMGVPRAVFHVTGTPKSYTKQGGSGKNAVRHFCPDCGSLLFGTPEVIPDIVTIYVGSLDRPELFTPDHVIFTRDRPAWLELCATLPEHHTTR